MITQLKAAIALRASLGMFALNPVKLTIILMIYSSIITLRLWHMTAATWFPLIFYILFIGGILIMFIILSSGIPNEKAMKLKIELLLVTAIATIRTFFPRSTTVDIATAKRELMTQHSFTLLAAILVLYFFFFLKIVSRKKYPARNFFSCPYRKICKLSNVKVL